MLIPQSPTRRPHAAGFRDKLAVLGFSIYWTDLARRARVAVLDILSRIAFDRVQKHIKSDTRKSLNAFISAAGDRPGFDQEIQEAIVRHENGPRKSSLDGSLIGVKDNICTLSEPTTCASAILEQFQSPFQADVVKRLEDHGAFVTGKTNLDEFGMGSHSINSHFGPVHNPRNRYGHLRSAGGSSGGSAVAVSTQQRPIALGTDTGGSVRLPAAYNGIRGFKPSYGLLSRWGVVAYANSLDTVGLMARSDVAMYNAFRALLMAPFPKISSSPNTLVQDALRDPTVVERVAEAVVKRVAKAFSNSEYRVNLLRKFRIGVPKEYNTKEMDPSIRSVWLKGLQALQQDGHSIHSVSLPTTQIALSAYYVIAAAEASSNLAKYDGVRYGKPRELASSGLASFAETRGLFFGQEVKRRILLGSYTLSAGAIDNNFIKAQKVRRLVQSDFNKVFRRSSPLVDRQNAIANEEGVDFLLTPTATTLPPTLSSLSCKSSVDTFSDDVLTVPASLAGLPAYSIPVYCNREHNRAYPELYHIGMQVIGQYGDDMDVLCASAHFRNKITKILRESLGKRDPEDLDEHSIKNG